MFAVPTSNPARDYAEGFDRAQAMMALDDARIGTNARTALHVHGTRAPWTVVLLHGLTNHPGQFAEFAPRVFATGANVIVPRMPKHGYADRMTDALASLRAEELVATTNEAIDIARGLGESVAILGISMGGLLAAFFGQHRGDVASAVPVAPDFAILQCSRGVTNALATIALAIPNLFLWWDPRAKQNQRPATAYPRFATHALMQTVRIGQAAYRAAKVSAPRASRIATVVNRQDPAVNNAVTLQVVDFWKESGANAIEYIEYLDLPKNHDIIDPDNPLARIETVYPRLVDALALL